MRLIMHISLILIAGIAILTVGFLITTFWNEQHKEKLVIVDGYIGVMDAEQGLGLYVGHYVNGASMMFEDTICIKGIGDTIIPLKIIK